MIAPVITLSHLYKSIYRPAQHAQSPDSTIEQYTISMQAFERHWLTLDPQTNYDVRHICQEQIDLFRVDRLREVKPSTVNRDLRHIKAVVNFGKRRRYIPRRRRAPNGKRLPPLEFNKLDEKLPDPQSWTVEEFWAILIACQKIKGNIRRVPRSLIMIVVVLLIINTSSRIGAIMKLRPRDDYNSATRVCIRRKETQKHNKTQSDRLLSITCYYLDQLDAMCDAGRPRLIPYMSARSVRHYYKKVLRLAGFPDHRRNLLHKIRGTTLTMVAIKDGLEAARKLGDHSSVNVTLKSYIDPTMAVQNDITNSLDWSHILRPLFPQREPLMDRFVEQLRGGSHEPSNHDQPGPDPRSAA